MPIGYCDYCDRIVDLDDHDEIICAEEAREKQGEINHEW